MKTEWDYSDCASTYDKRPDYSESAINQLLECLRCVPDNPVADIGAGTGKLTIPLCKKGLLVHCIEPNDYMRVIGKKNTKRYSVIWHEATGESTRLAESSMHHTFFGSSFSVTNQYVALKEVQRILVPNGGFSCLWNHRDLCDPVQSEIENIIKRYIPNYDYGIRRSDPIEVLNNSCLFGEITKIEDNFSTVMKKNDVIDAWRSHNTLYRQSKGKFENIISEISSILSKDTYEVPYTTRIWYARLAS